MSLKTVEVTNIFVVCNLHEYAITMSPSPSSAVLATANVFPLAASSGQQPRCGGVGVVGAVAGAVAVVT